MAYREYRMYAFGTRDPDLIPRRVKLKTVKIAIHSFLLDVQQKGTV